MKNVCKIVFVTLLFIFLLFIYQDQNKITIHKRHSPYSFLMNTQIRIPSIYKNYKRIAIQGRYIYIKIYLKFTSTLPHAIPLPQLSCTSGTI